jgi:hypothetical protein
VVIKTGNVTAVEDEDKKPVSMIDRVVMYTHPCGAMQFVVLPPPRTPKRSGKTEDRSVSYELRRERMKLTVSRSSLYY